LLVERIYRSFLFAERRTNPMAKKIKASELVKFAYSIIGTPYVYGMRGKKMTEDDYNRLKKQYGDLVWDSDKKKSRQSLL
jgi:hypothetical protein